MLRASRSTRNASGAAPVRSIRVAFVPARLAFDDQPERLVTTGIAIRYPGSSGSHLFGWYQSWPREPVPSSNVGSACTTGWSGTRRPSVAVVGLGHRPSSDGSARGGVAGGRRCCRRGRRNCCKRRSVDASPAA